jgi:hypothetical protein
MKTPEELMIETPMGLIKWRIIRKALVRLAHDEQRQEQFDLERYERQQKRMATIARKKAEKEKLNGNS